MNLWKMLCDAINARLALLSTDSLKSIVAAAFLIIFIGAPAAVGYGIYSARRGSGENHVCAR